MIFTSVKPNIFVRLVLCALFFAGATCNATPVHALDSDTLQTVVESDTVMVTSDTLALANDTIVVEPDSLNEETDTVRHAIAALKNNVLYDAIATMNLHAEFRLDEHWTLEAGVGFNPFPLDDKKFPKWRHIYVDITPRYWFCQAFTRDFVSVNLGYAHYNVGGGVYPIGWMYKPVQTNRFQGDALMFGASYGWVFPITPFFSIELEGGVDAGVTWYDQFTCVHCGKQLAEKQKAWFGLPRLGVNLVVLLDDNKPDFEDRCDCNKLHPYEEPADTVVVSDTIVALTDTIVEPADTVPAPIDTIAEPTVEQVIIATLKDTASLMDTIDMPAKDTVAAEPVVPIIPIIAPLVVPQDTVIEPVEPIVEPDYETEYIPETEIINEKLRQRIHEIEKELGANPSDAQWVIIDSLVNQQTEVAHTDQIRRLRSAVLRPLEEFEPYDPNQRIEKAPSSIFMHFDVDKSHVDRSFIHNDELMDSIMNVIDDALNDPTIEIKLIKIVGMASFDGKLATNEKLGASRAQALHDYIQHRFNFPEDMFRIYNGGECWRELRWYLSQEEFPNKEKVLDAIDNEPDVEKREWIIKRLDKGRIYKYMRTHFNRYLRNLGTITVYYVEK